MEIRVSEEESKHRDSADRKVTEQNSFFKFVVVRVDSCETCTVEGCSQHTHTHVSSTSFFNHLTPDTEFMSPMHFGENRRVRFLCENLRTHPLHFLFRFQIPEQGINYFFIFFIFFWGLKTSLFSKCWFPRT